MIVHNPFPTLRNWWCDKCREWIASVDMDMSQKHRKCQSRCWWLEYDVTFPFQPIDRININVCDVRSLV